MDAVRSMPCEWLARHRLMPSPPPLAQSVRMRAPLRYLLGSMTAAALLSACSDGHRSPTGVDAPLLATGSTGGGGSSTGGGSATGGGGSGGGGKVACTNTLSVAGSATESLSGNSFSATYVLVSCQSKARVSMTATDLTTGAVVWASVPDLAGTIAIWSLPYKLTSYRIDARAYAGSANTLVATASTVISTLDPLPCDVFVHETATVGYFGIYPAVWAATDAQDCGRGGSVRLRITNMLTGQVERDYPGLGFSSFIDFEGAVVPYSTPYRVYAELVSPTGEVLSSSTSDVTTSPLR